VIRFGNVGADFINTIAPGSGGKLWLGTGVQVIRYDPPAAPGPTTYPNPADPDSRSVNSTTTIVEDKLGRVWMGSEWSGGGLDLLDPKHRQVPPLPPPARQGRVAGRRQRRPRCTRTRRAASGPAPPRASTR
jgi:hypothetical protein